MMFMSTCFELYLSRLLPPGPPSQFHGVLQLPGVPAEDHLPDVLPWLLSQQRLLLGGQQQGRRPALQVSQRTFIPSVACSKWNSCTQALQPFGTSYTPRGQTGKWCAGYWLESFEQCDVRLGPCSKILTPWMKLWREVAVGFKPVTVGHMWSIFKIINHMSFLFND